MFPNFPGSRYDRSGVTKIRNATVTTIAPTGTLSIIADCSGGIEPLFALSFTRHVLGDVDLPEISGHFLEIAKERSFLSSDVLMRITAGTPISQVPGVPEDVKRVFVTTFDIVPEWHVRMQAAFQRHTDNAVSKTINFPPQATLARHTESIPAGLPGRSKGDHGLPKRQQGRTGPYLRRPDVLLTG